MKGLASTMLSFRSQSLLHAQPRRTTRFLVPSIAILIITAIIFYKREAFLSDIHGHILPLNDYLSSFTSNGDHRKNDVVVDADRYHEVFSVSTEDKKYFLVDFVDKLSINPNIVPHPLFEDMWIVVAQRHMPESKLPMIFAEIFCTAAFQNGTLRCVSASSILPVETMVGDKCEGEVLVLNLNRGPHDARVFYGPDGMYTVYGSNSQFTCFGQWIQDFGLLMDWREEFFPDTQFKVAAELQRPLPYGHLEKNWFVFWDHDGQLYAHHDVYPKRVFAKLEVDGSVGEDLAPQAAISGDNQCLEKYMPEVQPANESIHQATNSISVTMCKRADPGCVPNDENTFILTIFQHKRFRYFHSVYEPYVMLFEQKAPFKIHGMSSKPFWIHGRWKPTELESEQGLSQKEIEEEKIRIWRQTEMFYVTSISWKSWKQRYHGYIDDVVFLGFGIEDSRSAGIDVVVGDLLMNIGHC